MISNKKIYISFLIIILSYAIWNGRNLLLGPKIEIYPNSEENISHNPINIKGLIKNASFISLNGRQVFVDNDGSLSEEVLQTAGYNVIEVYARDRFGKEKTEFVQIYNDESYDRHEVTLETDGNSSI